MAVLHDYYCQNHGIFEAWEAKCPMKGCKGEISKVFLQPVGLKSDKTKKTDKTLQNLALDFGMSDIQSTREGEHQENYLQKVNVAKAEDYRQAQHEEQIETQEARPGDAAIWGGAGGMQMGNLLKGNMFKSIRGEQVGINPNAAGNLTGPRAASYIADHENLSIPK